MALETILPAKQLYTYTGLVTQDDFKTRLNFLQSRLKVGYTQEEVSFLLGKLPYYYAEYEEMKHGTKINDDEKNMLHELLDTENKLTIRFERDENGNDYTRIIKGERELKKGIIHHTIAHPWLSNDKNKKTAAKASLTFKFLEVPFYLTRNEEELALKDFQIAVDRLINRSYFKYPQSPAQIYERIKFGNSSSVLRPIFLKKVLYNLLSTSSIKIANKNNCIHFYQA